MKTSKMTCDVCPVKATCSALCNDMTLILRGVEMTHEVRGEFQMFDVEGQDEREWTKGRSEFRKQQVESHETEIIKAERAQMATEKLMEYINAYAEKTSSRKNANSKELLVKLLTYSLFDNHTDIRVAELIGEEFPNSAYANNSVIMQLKPAFKKKRDVLSKGDGAEVKEFTPKKAYAKVVSGGLKMVRDHITRFNLFVRNQHINEGLSRSFQNADLGLFKIVC